MIQQILAIPATGAICATSGALNSAPCSRRALAAAATALALLAPWLVSSDAPGVRVACAGGAVLALFRNLDIYRGQGEWSARRRAIHVVGTFDSRRLARVPHQGAWALWIRLGAFGVPTAVLSCILMGVRTPQDVAAWALRWTCGAVWAYTSIETLTAFAQALAGLFGVQLPKLHDDPILSRSLSEFWGRRWNLSVRDMLYEHCFRPLRARAGPEIAVIGTFGASALLHFWLTLAAAGPTMAASMASYFLIEGALVLAERAISVRQWRVTLRRAWTAGCVLLPLPLLLEPLLNVTLE